MVSLERRKLLYVGVKLPPHIIRVWTKSEIVRWVKYLWRRSRLHQRLCNGPIWSDHHQQHPGTNTPGSDCYVPFGRSDQWARDALRRRRMSAGTLGARPHFQDFLQMQRRLKMDSDDLWHIRKAQHPLKPDKAMNKWGISEKPLQPLCLDEA